LKKDAFSRQYRANINLEPEDVMFNSGVMLIDLNRWKRQKVEERLLKFIAMKQGRIQQGD
jgi:lipopolysaccharide biosynthesis glycosyltransferase